MSLGLEYSSKGRPARPRLVPRRTAEFQRTVLDLIAGIMRDLRKARDHQEEPVRFFAEVAEIVAEELQLTRAPRTRGDTYGFLIADPIDKFLRENDLDRAERRLLLARINVQIAEELVLEAEKLLETKKPRR
jgi:hypothetical protein